MLLRLSIARGLCSLRLSSTAVNQLSGPLRKLRCFTHWIDDQKVMFKSRDWRISVHFVVFLGSSVITP